MRKQLTILFAILISLPACAAAPETVAVTYHFRESNEARLLDAIERQWSIGHERGYFVGDHALYQGRGFFLEVLTWRDGSIPDDAPAEILEIWKEMDGLVDHESGGIEIRQVRAVPDGQRRGNP